MDGVSLTLRAEVVARAGNRCEYCQLSQARQEATFHVDHDTPKAIRGLTVLDILALACVSCSLRKGARQFAPDPDTGGEVATVAALALNRPLIVAIRREEIARGRHPPESARK